HRKVKPTSNGMLLIIRAELRPDSQRTQRIQRFCRQCPSSREVGLTTGVVVERRTIVAFEEQRWSVLFEQAFQMGGDLPTVELGGDQWTQAITGGEVLKRNDDLTVVAPFGGVTGPSHA